MPISPSFVLQEKVLFLAFIDQRWNTKCNRNQVVVGMMKKCFQDFRVNRLSVKLSLKSLYIFLQPILGKALQTIIVRQTAKSPAPTPKPRSLKSKINHLTINTSKVYFKADKSTRYCCTWFLRNIQHLKFCAGSRKQSSQISEYKPTHCEHWFRQ